MLSCFKIKPVFLICFIKDDEHILDNLIINNFKWFHDICVVRAFAAYQ